MITCTCIYRSVASLSAVLGTRDEETGDIWVLNQLWQVTDFAAIPAIAPQSVTVLFVYSKTRERRDPWQNYAKYARMIVKRSSIALIVSW